jgi:hypothetical protein
MYCSKGQALLYIMYVKGYLQGKHDAAMRVLTHCKKYTPTTKVQQQDVLCDDAVSTTVVAGVF